MGRKRIAAVAVGMMLAVFGVPAGPASAAEYDFVYVVSPNLGAKVSGTLTWYSKRSWKFDGWIQDAKCNSHDVWVDIMVNRRYAWDHYAGFWRYWMGVEGIGTWRNSNGCGTKKNFVVNYIDPGYDDHDVDFRVCDDGFTNSCSDEDWPNDWYGVYHNPYASW